MCIKHKKALHLITVVIRTTTGTAKPYTTRDNSRPIRIINLIRTVFVRTKTGPILQNFRQGHLYEQQKKA